MVSLKDKEFFIKERGFGNESLRILLKILDILYVGQFTQETTGLSG